jgi:UDP-N-acetylmuramoylalanine--D-glutamate ligase
VAVLLNITPDHLDRYGYSFDNYVASKCRIFENQKPGDVLVYNTDDDVTRARVELLAPSGVVCLPFSTRKRLGAGAWVEGGMMFTEGEGKAQDIVPVDEISIRGIHNLQNAMAATLAARALHVPVASLRATLRNFKGVEHRLEFVREWNGITFVNDSKATNVDSVWYALQSFTTPIVLLLGGRDKGNDYSRLTDLVRRRVKAVIAIGESADRVRTAFATVVPTAVAASMDEAVHMASVRAGRGDTVLLSPACSSFDWFTNYEHRGRVFKEIVMNL